MKRCWVIIFGSHWWVGHRRETWYCGPKDSLYQMVQHPSAVGLTVADDKASANMVKPKNWQYKLLWYHKSHQDCPGVELGHSQREIGDSMRYGKTH